MLERLAIGFFCVIYLAVEAPAATADAGSTAQHQSKEPQDPTGFLDVRDKDGVSLRDRGATSEVRHHVDGFPHLGSLIVTKIKQKAADDNCGYLVTKVVDSIKYHLAKRQKNTFVSAEEAKAFVNLEDGENGREVLSNTMRVLSNYTLAEGIMSGTLWTIDNQDHLISCEENINMRLDEHSVNEFGDILVQGDMAVTSSLCRYSEMSSKVSDVAFDVGTMSCMGVTGCQFAHPDEAVHFCNSQPECTMVMGKEDDTGCEGGLGCYTPRKGEPQDDASWSTGGGRTYIKLCPGALLQVEEAAEQGSSLRNAGSRWNGGEVNYCFSAEVTPLVQQSFHIAVERIKTQVPCLHFQFVERVNDTHCTSTPSIIVQSQNSGCWSYVGQVSDKESSWRHRSQPLNLGRGCELVGIVLHELGHALGMVHENARADRSNVMKLNTGNITEGKQQEFSMSSDVVKYGWAGHDTCATRAGRTKVTMTTADCLAVHGFFDGNVGLGAGGTVDCQLDLCEAGTYFPAPSNKCDSKVAEMTIKMERKDCLRARGTPPASPMDSWAWVACGFDICTDMGLHLAKPFACENKLAYGYILTQAADCTNMEGSISVQHQNGQDWVNCYMDFCSGQFDAPFDFLSLMMYSPYAWSKSRSALTLEPEGKHAAKLAAMMGQRMGFSALDIYHLGHMYDCYEHIKPDFDSKDVSHRIETGAFFEFTGKCEDKPSENTGFDIHGEEGFMKHASCNDLMPYCQNDTMGESVRLVCPVSCFVCAPDHGLSFRGDRKAGSCFDAVNTGIRFRDGPKATCKDLVRYCNHTTIGPSVYEACKLTCGGCDLHVEAPYIGVDGKCEDAQMEDEPHFTIAGKDAPCWKMGKYCDGHMDSFLIVRKCPLTCGLCEEHPTHPPPKKTEEVYIPGDSNNCNRRRRFGFCSTRRRRNI